MLHLHVGGEHGVGRREHSAEQDCRAERQPQAVDARERDERDRHDHRDRGEPHGQPPAPVRERAAQLQPGGEERDEYRHFRQALQQRRPRERVEVDQPQPGGAEADAHAEVEQRRRQRQPLDERGGERHPDEERADDQKPQLESHAVFAFCRTPCLSVTKKPNARRSLPLRPPPPYNGAP
jgi:hypothetical protein